jgi:hypothetical protein
MICNFGLFLSLTDLGVRWKKNTFCILLMSAASSWFIFYLPSVNPVAVRSVLSFSSLGFVLFIMGLIGLHKNEI